MPRSTSLLTATVTDAPDVLAWADFDAVLVTAGSIARAVVDLLVNYYA